MRFLSSILLFAAAIQTVPATAQTVRSPLLGRWTVDVSRLPMPPEARPKSVTFTFRDAGAGKWSTNVDIINGDESERHMTATYVPDGTPSPIEGDKVEADTAAAKIPVPNVMVLELIKGGALSSTRVYSVAADGNTMIETAAYVGSDGTPVMRTNYFTREQ